MNIFAADAGDYGAAARRPLGVLAGLCLSLLLHVLFVFGYRYGWAPPGQIDDGKRVESMTVWIRPRTPLLAPQPRTIVPERKMPPSRKIRREPSNSEPVSNAPPTTVNMPAPRLDPVPQQTEAPAAGPKFDMEAARKVASTLATEREPTRAATAAGQLDDKPLYPPQTETRLVRNIAQGKRANCKEGIPGGLLAPLYLLLDRKDSGCKW